MKNPGLFNERPLDFDLETKTEIATGGEAINIDTVHRVTGQVITCICTDIDVIPKVIFSTASEHHAWCYIRCPSEGGLTTLKVKPAGIIQGLKSPPFMNLILGEAVRVNCVTVTLFVQLP